MVFLDANLFVVDRFFHRDALLNKTRAFLLRLPEIDGIVPLLTLLEICGVASFRLSPQETAIWLSDFSSLYAVRVLDPFGAGETESNMWVASYADDIGRYIARRMTLGDAILAREADRYDAEAIVTWNVRDFVDRTAAPVFTPDEFLQHHG